MSALLAYASLSMHPDLYVVSARRAQVRTDILLRPGTADQDVFNEVFVAREYDVEGLDPRTIVDAGAHIGLTSVRLANRYPHARILAIEPEPENFAVLKRNVRGYPNIEPMRAGLWSHPTTLRIDNPEAATWAFRVSEAAASEAGVRAVSIPLIMEKLGVATLDLVKLDIEGSEIEVLHSAASWIGCVDTLMIELHDRYRAGCTEALETALAGYEYERSKRGNTVIIRHIRRAALAVARV